MNKNLPVVILIYGLSLLLALSLEKWFSIWMILEMNTLTFVTLLMLKSKTSEISISYFLVQMMASLVIVSSLYTAMLNAWFTCPNSLFLFSLIFKLAVGPAHSWLIPVALKLKWLMLFLIISFQKIIPLIMLEIMAPELSILIVFFCMSTAVVGSISNMSSNSLKKMILFSSIATMAWILMAVNFDSKTWKLFLIVYFITLVIITFQSDKMSPNITNKQNFIMWLSVGGVPPLIGFFPKIIILISLLLVAMKFMVMLLFGLSLVDIYIYSRQSYSSMFNTYSKQTNNLIKMEQKSMLLWVLASAIVLISMC